MPEQGPMWTIEDLQRLADEDLMPLVERKEPAAFEIVYDRHGGAAYSLAYRIVGDRGGRRGRHAGGIPLGVAQRRALRPRARQRADLAARRRAQPRDRRAAARVGPRADA